MAELFRLRDDVKTTRLAMQYRDWLVMGTAQRKLPDDNGKIPTIWPTDGTVTSLFGDRIHPILKRSRFHAGVDISNSKDTDIVATADGTVKYSGTRGGYGKTVVVDHGNGFESLYGHAEDILVRVGDTVKKGELIASMGSTGVSTGEHLHYEVRYAGEAVDPVGFVQ